MHTDTYHWKKYRNRKCTGHRKCNILDRYPGTVNINIDPVYSKTEGESIFSCRHPLREGTTLS